MSWRARSSALPLRAALIVAVAAGACQGSAGPQAPLPVGAPEVVVTMDEYRFDFATPVPAGRVVFRVRNEGELPHRLTLVPLPEDLPPLDQQLRGTTRQYIAPFAGVSDRQPARQPGDSGMFAVDLAAGRRYGVICFLEDPDGQTHAVKGMLDEFRAGPDSAAAPGS